MTDYQKPEIRDLGAIGDHTFINPGGDDKGAAGHDPFGELSAKNGS